LLEHFTSAIKDDSARPQIAQLTELGLVELTRKRQGQNIYELFGAKCSKCNGTGHIEIQFNYEISNLKINNIEDKAQQSNSIKLDDIDTSLSTDKQEKIIEKEVSNPINQNKDDSSYIKENENNDLNKSISKEKNTITVDLTNDEKIVFSQLGINPLIKLGKQYLTSNNFVRLKDNSIEKEKTLENKQTTTKQIKEISETKAQEDIEPNIKENATLKDEVPKNTKENEELLSFDNKNEDETELTDEINNARKKRRRSSAVIE
jgi:ribonuclease E